MAGSVIVKPDSKPLDMKGMMNMPAELIPSFRINHAIEHGTSKNILVRFTGGIGDSICAEPAIRYLTKIKGVKVSIAYDFPELFQHLPLVDRWNTKIMSPDLSRYFVLDAFHQDGDFANEFIAPPFVHCVDYCTLNLFRGQLPRKDCWVKLQPNGEQSKKALENINPAKDVVIHPGKTWPSRTMPKDWWDEVTKLLKLSGARPVFIGDNIVAGNQTRGTVDVNASDCLDLRNELTIMESVAVTQAAKVVLTNDSAPLHFAASGRAWIGFLSTVRHPEIITHYRQNGDFGWRMQNFAKGGHWENMTMHPVHSGSIRMDMVRESEMRRWLPSPVEVAEWALEKLNTPD